MRSYDALVIGGGVNGLVAGAVLARAGKTVCVLERSDHLGGMATLRQDDGPALAHLTYNLGPRVAQDIGLGKQGWPFQQTELPTVSLCDTGRHVVLRGKIASFADGSAHPDAVACAGLVARLVRYGDLLRPLAEAAPPGGVSSVMSAAGLKQLARLGRLGLALKGQGKAETRQFLQALLSNAYDLILDEIPDGPLAGLFAADAVRGNATGPRAPGTVFNLIYRMGHGGAASLPHGGMETVIAALAEAARTAGCQIETGTGVTRILMEGDKVTGVETEAGEVLNAPQVLTSSGPLRACEMAGLHQFDIETTRRMRHIRARGTTAKINLKLGARPEVPGLPDDLYTARWVIAPSAEYVERAFNPTKYGEMSEAPVIEATMPSPNATPLWLSAIVHYAPVDLKGGWTDAAREHLLSNTLAALNRVVPGLSDLVETAQIITPDQIEAQTGAPGGHWHHAEMSLDQLLNLRPGNGLGRYAMGPLGLYLCGASAHPGGDIMGLAGRNAALAALEAMS